MGATDEQIAAAGVDEAANQVDAGIEVVAPNWPALRLFLAVSHQWHQVCAPNGRLIRTGMDWQQVEIRARHLPEVRDMNAYETDRLWQDLQTMQNAALEYMAEHRNDR